MPPFDFRLPGVTSMSADTHKYGYAAKGTSVVLYRGAELRHQQYFTITDWPGGLYSADVRRQPPGRAERGVLGGHGVDRRGGLPRRDAADPRDGRRGSGPGSPAIDGLRVLGDPLFCIAFATEADELAIYRVLDAMTARGWSLNGLQRPPAVHLCVTLRHTAPGVAERFLADLRASVDEVRDEPPAEGGMAPIYGMATQSPTAVRSPRCSPRSWTCGSGPELGHRERVAVRVLEPGDAPAAGRRPDAELSARRCRSART